MIDYPDEVSCGFKPGSLLSLINFGKNNKKFAFAEKVIKTRAAGKEIFMVDSEHPEGGYYV